MLFLIEIKEKNFNSKIKIIFTNSIKNEI